MWPSKRSGVLSEKSQAGLVVRFSGTLKGSLTALGRVHGEGMDNRIDVEDWQKAKSGNIRYLKRRGNRAGPAENRGKEWHSEMPTKLRRHTYSHDSWIVESYPPLLPRAVPSPLCTLLPTRPTISTIIPPVSPVSLLRVVTLSHRGRHPQHPIGCEVIKHVEVSRQDKGMAVTIRNRPGDGGLQHA